MNDITKIFLDANIIIMEGKRFNSPKIKLMIDLANANLIEILTTDLSIMEIVKHFTEHDYQSIKSITNLHTQDLLKKHLNVTVNSISQESLREKIFDDYVSQVAELFNELSAEKLSIDDIKPTTIFNDYCRGTGFFTALGKKDQFSDAFIFECLKSIALQSLVIIVSNDKDYIAPVAESVNIELVNSIDALLNKIGLVTEEHDIKSIIASNENEFIAHVDSEVDNWGLTICDVEDAEVTNSNVIAADLIDYKSFKFNKPSDRILVVGRMKVTTNIEYTHPDWDHSVYDSEDKVRFAFENVNREKEINFEVNFSMAIELDETEGTSTIDELSFSNTDDFNYIEIEDDYNPYY